MESGQSQGDNLYAASVIAIRPKTGEIVWHYQFAPNDASTATLWELILADLKVDGQMRKVVMQMNRNGFLYVLDRTERQAAVGEALRQGQLGRPTST